MERNEQDMERRIHGSRIGGGIFLLFAGCLLLAYKMGAPIPAWVFTWPVLLIAIGFLTGIKSRFHNPGLYYDGNWRYFFSRSNKPGIKLS